MCAFKKINNFSQQNYLVLCLVSFCAWLWHAHMHSFQPGASIITLWTCWRLQGSQMVGVVCCCFIQFVSCTPELPKATWIRRFLILSVENQTQQHKKMESYMKYQCATHHFLLNYNLKNPHNCWYRINLILLCILIFTSPINFKVQSNQIIH